MRQKGQKLAMHNLKEIVEALDFIVLAKDEPLSALVTQRFELPLYRRGSKPNGETGLPLLPFCAMNPIPGSI